MRTKLIETNKPEKYVHVVRNVDTSPAGLVIPAGTPLILNLSATPQPSAYNNGLAPGWEDGLQVVLPSSAGFAPTQLYHYGVAAGPIQAQQLGETVVFGMCMAAVIRATRSATTVNWASGASVAAATNFLIVDTANNCFITGSSNSLGSPYLLVDNLPSFTSMSSTPGDTRTSVTQLVRAFVRAM